VGAEKAQPVGLPWRRLGDQKGRGHGKQQRQIGVRRRWDWATALSSKNARIVIFSVSCAIAETQSGGYLTVVWNAK
jgi:hypothetical protein